MLPTWERRMVSPGRTRPEGLRARILVVDDEPIIAMTLSEILRFQGYQVARAASGEEAVAKAASFAPDFLLSDIMLPGIDGVEAANQIKAMGCGCKVLFMSGQTSIAGDALLRAAGYEFDFVAKPVAPHDLILKIEEMLLSDATIKPLVLTVEQNEVLRVALAAALRASGYLVEEAETGGAAIEILARCALACALGHAGFKVHEIPAQAGFFDDTRVPDAVVLEAYLPDGCGVDVHRVMKHSLAEVAGIPVVYMAPAECMEAVREAAKGLGAAMILSYPINPVALASALRSIIGAA
jgi:CheY-like chemotaxis protein